jgi:hypothetical protein
MAPNVGSELSELGCARADPDVDVSRAPSVTEGEGLRVVGVAKGSDDSMAEVLEEAAATVPAAVVVTSAAKAYKPEYFARSQLYWLYTRPGVADVDHR